MNDLDRRQLAALDAYWKRETKRNHRKSVENVMRLFDVAYGKELVAIEYPSDLEREAAVALAEEVL